MITCQFISNNTKKMTLVLLPSTMRPPSTLAGNVARFAPYLHNHSPATPPLQRQPVTCNSKKSDHSLKPSTPSCRLPSSPVSHFPDVDRDLWDVLELATDEELDALHATLHRPSLLSPLVKSVVASQEPASVAICGRAALMLRIEQRFRFLAVRPWAPLPKPQPPTDVLPHTNCANRQTPSWCSEAADPATETHSSCCANGSTCSVGRRCQQLTWKLRCFWLWHRYE